MLHSRGQSYRKCSLPSVWTWLVLANRAPRNRVAQARDRRRQKINRFGVQN
jgi:hypothetical protein